MRVIGAGIVSSLLPTVADACAVCVGGNEENRIAFIVTTIFLTIVPLIVIGGTVRWAQKKAEAIRKLEAENDLLLGRQEIP